MANYLQSKEIDVSKAVNLIFALEYDLHRDGSHWTARNYVGPLAQIFGVFLGYIGAAKSENALSFAELT